MNVLIACENSGVIRDAFIENGDYAWSCDLLLGEGNHPQHHIQDDIFNVLNINDCAYTLPNGDAMYPNIWDLMIAHPDCTYLTNSAAWAYNDHPMIKGKPRNIKPGTLIGAKRQVAREKALNFVRALMNAPIKRIAIENPVGVIGTTIRKADQYIQPYDYGHDASKRTGLWLKNLPKLVADPELYVPPRMICDICRGQSTYAAVFNKGCIHCGAEAGLLKPRWANQTDSGQNKLPPTKDRWKLRANTYQGWADAMVKQWGGNKSSLSNGMIFHKQNGGLNL